MSNGTDHPMTSAASQNMSPQEQARLFYVYILTCADGTYYTGSTTDIERRLQEHNSARSGAHYTKTRRPVELSYFETFTTLRESRQREYAIKQLTRQKKSTLIATKLSPQA